MKYQENFYPKETVRPYAHTFGKDSNFTKKHLNFSDVNKSQNLEFNNNIIEDTTHSKILDTKRFQHQELTKQYFLNGNQDVNN